VLPGEPGVILLYVEKEKDIQKRLSHNARLTSITVPFLLKRNMSSDRRAITRMIKPIQNDELTSILKNNL
jgi:hypothetical protein